MMTSFLYVKVRDFYCGKDFKGDPPLYKKVLAGLTTGAFGILIANPTDVEYHDINDR